MINDVIEAIDQIAVKDPERVAYDYLGKLNTYGELKKRSDNYAAKIAQLGIPTKAPIIIWGGQTFEMIASFLGAVKAGHAYIPIASYSNSERITMIQEVSKAPAIIAIDPLPIELEDIKVLKPYEVPNNEVSSEITSYVSGDDNFYIIFTSGTTGKPKGVQISHDNLLSFVNWEIKDFNLPEQPSFLSQAPYSFDLSVMSLYPALVLGGKLVVLSHEITENFGKLFQTMPKLKFNVWVSTPSFAEMSFLDTKFNEKHRSELTHFLFCGEELSHKTADTLKKKFPNSKIFNTYGPTETTVAVTGVEISDEVLNKYDRLPIGVAKSDTKISIDKSKGEKEDQGEVIITGPSVSKGYLNNPEKTKAAFYQNDNEKYLSYRAGDLGYLDGDVLFYRGRIDFQVKFNGFRIELEEINFYLDKNKLVKYGVVAPKYNKDHKVQQLVAVVELADDAKKADYKNSELIKKIRETLGKDVMPYMLPQRFIFRDRMPISQNGKVDIKQVIKEVNNA